MAMSDPEDRYFVYENRLASFHGPQPVAKRRASNASSRTPKTLKWPHKSPSPAELAKAGFYFFPSPANPDNVICFLCNKNMDGWEEDDNPVEEHVKHSGDCGWAIVAAIEAEIGDWGTLHPLDPRILHALKATFGGRWPYEGKKGFKCKTKQLAEAGWKYTPGLQSDDMVTCAYCGLAIDGWEPGDKPIDEHYKRVKTCAYFMLINSAPAPPKKGRAKIAGSSKVSRTSVQSVTTVTSDMPSFSDITMDHDDSVMTMSSFMTQGGKKSRARKVAAPKAKKTRAKRDEAFEVTGSNPMMVEEARPPPYPKGKARKRASNAMDESTLIETEAPALKRRATRARTSKLVDTSLLPVDSRDVSMEDNAGKKLSARQRGRAGSGTKSTRKFSQTSLRSQASTASLRAHIDDDELDRQLQADLDRPLTDEEELVVDSDSERRKTSARAKQPKRAGCRKTSVKHPEPPSENYGMFDPEPPQPDEAEIEAELKTLKAEVETECKKLAATKKGRKASYQNTSQKLTKTEGSACLFDTAGQTLEDFRLSFVSSETEKAITEPVFEAVEVLQPDNSDVADGPETSTGTIIIESSALVPEVNWERGRPRKLASLEAAAAAKDLAAKGAAEAASAPALAPAQASWTACVEVEADPDLKKSRRPASSVQAQRRSSTRLPTEIAATLTSSALIRKPVPESAQGRGKGLDKSLPPRPTSSTSKLPRPPNTLGAHATPSAKQAVISPSQSPQHSDAENQRPIPDPEPSSQLTASIVTKRVVLAPGVATPRRNAPSRRNLVVGLQSTTPWTAVDLDQVFSSPTKGQESGEEGLLRQGAELSTPERGMTVEEWIFFNAGRAEQALKAECEAMVSAFERQGARAMEVLEGLVVE